MLCVVIKIKTGVRAAGGLSRERDWVLSVTYISWRAR
jgi:hypothetical protein